MTSKEVRATLVDALKLDLVGPWPRHAFANELLPENPTRWYLTGYLVPESAPVEHRSDAETKERKHGGQAAPAAASHRLKQPHAKKSAGAGAQPDRLPPSRMNLL